MKKIVLATLAAGVSLIAVPAQAGNFLGHYAATDGSGLTADFNVTFSDTLNAVGGHDITAIGGTVIGSAITGLFANPNQPYDWLTADGLFSYDQVFRDAGYASNLGWMVGTASGIEYNLFSNGDGSFTLAGGQGGHYINVSTGTLDAAAVPEAATWAMMLAGFGMIGFAMRARKPAVSFG